ncbi:hypothetical protein BH20ACT5_BH20ACT5_08450 [soil metagenome]
MARISLDPPRTPLLRLGEWYSRRKYGDVLDSGRAYAHNTRVLMAYWGFERKVAKWHTLDAGLQHLAVMSAATRIGCSWCMDFGAWAATSLGLPADKIRAVPRWRQERESFTELECLVMEYAEAMTDTPPSVSDELAADLRERLGDAAFVELTAIVAVENLRSRVNSAFGLTGQGFANRCAIAPR